MNEINLLLKVRPRTFPNGIKTREVKDSLSGPMCKTCSCGKHYASFKMDPETDFNAFRNAIQMSARSFMTKHGMTRPLAGAIRIDVEVGVPHPLTHFDKDDNMIDDCRNRLPMKLPAFYRIMEAVAKCLYGVAFTDMKQISKSSFSRVYRDCHCIDITVSEVNPSDIDDEIKQLELF